MNVIEYGDMDVTAVKPGDRITQEVVQAWDGHRYRAVAIIGAFNDWAAYDGTPDQEWQDIWQTGWLMDETAAALAFPMLLTTGRQYGAPKDAHFRFFPDSPRRDRALGVPDRQE